MKELSLNLDLLGALALFNLIQDSPPDRVTPMIEKLEESLRQFLYGELSIDEMENSRELERKLRIEMDARKAGE